MSLDLLSFSCTSAPLLHTFLTTVSAVHGPFVQRLSLPPTITGTYVQQESLEGFTALRYLSMFNHKCIWDVSFCGATLEVLLADWSGLCDEGLQNATRLQVLHCDSCEGVTTLEPFAATLRELDASHSCGLNRAALAHARHLTVLSIHFNESITSLPPSLAANLRELRVGCQSDTDPIGDEQLREATSLVYLDASTAPLISTVAPFAKSLRVLSCGSGFTDESAIPAATQLVRLNLVDARRVTVIVEASATSSPPLLELVCGSGLTDASLAPLRRLVSLTCYVNPHITTVKPFGTTLRHLQVGWDSVLSLLSSKNQNNSSHDGGGGGGQQNSPVVDGGGGGRGGGGGGGGCSGGLCDATRLVTLSLGYTTRIDTIQPFQSTLESLRIVGPICGVPLEEIVAAPRLWLVDAKIDKMSESLKSTLQNVGECFSREEAGGTKWTRVV